MGADALSTTDLLAMRLSNAEVLLAKSKLECAKKAFEMAAMSAELNAARLEAQSNRNLATTKAQAEETERQLKQTLDAARILAEEIASKYAVDWRNASFDPVSGNIIPLPGEPTPCPQ